MSADHTHDEPTGGPEDGAADWFRILDILVWGAVIIIGTLGVEWLVGRIMRERIAHGAQAVIAKANAARGAGTE